MKYIITVSHLQQRPTDWTNQKAWPAPGIYTVEDDSSMYHVSKWSVDYIGNTDGFLKQPCNDDGGTVSETLLLKAIAAAARAEVLK